MQGTEHRDLYPPDSLLRLLRPFVAASSLLDRPLARGFRLQVVGRRWFRWSANRSLLRVFSSSFSFLLVFAFENCNSCTERALEFISRFTKSSYAQTSRAILVHVTHLQELTTFSLPAWSFFWRSESSLSIVAFTAAIRAFQLAYHAFHTRQTRRTAPRLNRHR